MARQGRTAQHVAHDRPAAAVQGRGRGRAADRARVSRRRERAAAWRHRLLPADARRPVPRQRRARLSEAGAAAAQSRDRRSTRWSIASCSTAAAPSAVEYSRGGKVERVDADSRDRSSPRARSARRISCSFRASARPSIWAASASPVITPCPGVGPEPAGPLHRAHDPSGDRTCRPPTSARAGCRLAARCCAISSSATASSATARRWSRPRSRCWTNPRRPTCNARSRPAASRKARSARWTISPASPAACGRCGP